jgi:hypothetical protein
MRSVNYYLPTIVDVDAALLRIAVQLPTVYREPFIIYSLFIII